MESSTLSSYPGTVTAAASQTRRKTVALAEWNWTGHHPSFFAHNILALESLGFDILALCPKPADAREMLSALRIRYDLPATARVDYDQVGLHSRRFQWARPARLSAIDWTYRHFRSIEKTVAAWGRKVGQPVELIFYSCIYDWDFEWRPAIAKFLKTPWAGLYLHPISLRTPGVPNARTGRVPNPGKMFADRLCRGVCITDEGFTGRMSEQTGVPTFAFPELTDQRLAQDVEAHGLTRRLRRFSDGGPVVGMFGYLQRYKGLIPFLEAAQDPRLKRITFALGGEVNLSDMTPADLARANEGLVKAENIWTHLTRIPDGEEINTIMAACDVIYAAYLDFPHSSNIMTKCALLRKPVIVSDKYLMAERVRKYRLGEVVPEGDVNAIVEAILKITSDPVAWRLSNEPQWDTFLAQHSFARLQEAWGELLNVTPSPAFVAG